MKLYCVRHGEACAPDQDPARPLTPGGCCDVEKIARHLGQNQTPISHILHSGKLRAKQTAMIFADQLHAEQIVECSSLLDENSPIEPLLEMVGTWTEDTMLVGHLPFMAQFVSALVLKDASYFPIVNFPPGAVVCLDYYEDSRWVINWVLRPSLFSA